MPDDPHSPVIDALSPKRLNRYAAPDGSPEKTLRAYTWALSLRQALLKPLDITEVMLRNTLDYALREWWTARGHRGCWTDEKAAGEEPVLDALVHRKDWKRRARQYVFDRTVTHDDIIAHTSFGTWRNIIGNPAAIPSARQDSKESRDSRRAAKVHDNRCAQLWNAALNRAFPNIPSTKRKRGGQSPRGYIGARVSRAAALRNRVCHWDSLLTLCIPKQYESMREIVNAVDSADAEWLDEQCREEIDAVLAKRPDWI